MPNSRTTLNSQRALRPLTPEVTSQDSNLTQPLDDESSLAFPLNQEELNQLGQNLEEEPVQGSEPPTHPIQFVPDYELPVFPFPTISQLRDFPNLSVPLQRQPSVIVARPQSAPSTPARISSGDQSVTSSLSPGGVSITFSNPGFRPVPNVSTPAGAGSWDNFFQVPTYQQHDRSFWSTREVNKIQLVSTDISDSEDSTSPVPSIGFLDKRLNSDLLHISSTEVVRIPEMEKEVNELHALRVEVEDMCGDLSPDLITADSAPSMDSELSKIEVARNTYRNSVRKFLQTFTSQLSQTEAEQWKADMKVVVDKVNAHKMAVLAKVNKLLPPSSNMTEFEKASIELQKQQLALQQEAIKNKQQEVAAATKPLKKLVLDKCTRLEEELERVPVVNLKEGDDQQVTRIVLKLSEWKQKMESINKLNQELSTKTAISPMSTEEQSEVSAAIERAKVALDDIVSTAEDEDLSRQLYSLDVNTRGDQIKWPTFSGDCGEDYFKFKRDFQHAAKQNKTSARNQLSKLKENLKGFAKSLIPATVTDIERSFSILEHAFGDSMKVVNHRIDNLMKVGPWPAEGIKDCYSKQVLWIVKVQGLLQEIIDLAESNDDLAAVVYNREKVSQVLKLFPTFMVDKLARIAGYKKDKYDLIISRLDEWKSISQNRETIFGSSASVVPKQQQQQPARSNQSSSHINFPKPKRLPTCRICKVLEDQGETVGLYDNHISDFATGCPKFANMSVDHRMVIAREARYCINCMGKDVKYSFAHNRECQVKKKKGIYSCKKPSCLLHMWLCSKHTSENREQMEKFDRQLQAKAGIRLTFISQKYNQIKNLTLNMPVNSSDGLDDGKGTYTSADVAVPGSPLAYCTLGEKGIKQAVRKLHRLNKKHQPGVVTVSPPAGVPLFLFQPVEGLNGPVNVFYDKGCSDAVFREGVPGVQLRGALLSKGPFDMGGVGNLVTQAEEEWLVQLSRTDGKKQLVRGVTLKQLTCDFPAIDTSEAVKEIVASDPSNSFLQSCKVPRISGGKVDVLLGIQYSIIQPIPIQELDSGLTIYRSRLISHNSSENAIIGGPHTSFQYLAGKCGNSARLLAHFTEGLKTLRQLGPPRIPVNPISKEEELFALQHNSHELKDLIQQENGSTCSDYVSSKHEICSSCFLNQFVDSENVDTMREIKQLRLEQECGIDFNYRCIKCRDCQSCKESSQTEMLSFKEEAEMELIDQSVVLDLKNKQIRCSLPLRGEERQFLCTNYGKAKKILDQQIRQYANQPDTKQLIIKAFDKLFTNGHAAYIKDLNPEELSKFVHKEVQYYIPWRIAFSDSTTTPARPVLDASARTDTRRDGTGGKSLNDLVCLGKVDTLNLLNLFLNWRIGKYALCGDLQQFYNACKLDNSQWNLQRFLYKPEMNPDSPVLEGCIKTLIYGVSSVSAQSENAMLKLGKLVKEEFPEVEKLISNRRYVDDIATSKVRREDCVSIAQNADEKFDMVGLKCKSWTITGEDPDSKVSKDGVSISVGGSPWFPKLDCFIVKVPPLHFGRRKRGRLDKNTKFFVGSTLLEMDQFCPKNLNRKQVTSRFASIWDITGKLGPVLSEAKQLLSLTIQSTADWTSPMSLDLRSKWLNQFLLWEKLRGIRFERAVMPEDAVDDRMRLIQMVDATLQVVNQGCWAGFRKKTGGWSCQHILSRSLIAPKNSTIPKLELQSLTNGSNMCWLVRKMLKDWVEDYIICGDSIIALCWVSSEKKSLSMYHRNRVIQIRRGSTLDCLYHVTTEENIADLGTRPEKVKLTDIGPDSEWELGKKWMQKDINIAVNEGILRPIADLRIVPETDDEYKQGFLLGKDTPELMCNLANKTRISKIQDRLEFSNYLVIPTKHSFKKLVRIMAIVIGFISKCRKKRLESLTLTENVDFKFSTFMTSSEANKVCGTSMNSHATRNYPSSKCQLPMKTDTPNMDFSQGDSSNSDHLQTKLPNSDLYLPSDDYLSQALTYLYRKAAKEVIHFNTKSKVEKIATLKEGVLFSKARIVDGMNFVETGELKLTGLKDLGVRAYTPVIDRYSPLAYCIANYVHWDLARHRGPETCNRICLENVTIMQGCSLFKELSDECIRCNVKRKRYVEMPMGLISDHQLKVSPPFWVTQMDIFGPYVVYVPGFEKSTRNRQALKSECSVIIFACPVTRLINLQVIEKKDSQGIIDGVTRLACEIGVPKILLMDKDPAFVRSMTEVEFEFRDTAFKLHQALGIEFTTCPVSGHAQHGLVERRIRSVQECLRDTGLEKKRVHATGLQTLLKLVENQVNNLPLGYSFGKDQDNTALLRMISPNMLRIGRNNARALEGPMRLPRGGELLDQIQETYETWYRIWCETYIPKVMFQPKWFKMERDLREGDVVLFQKKDSVLEHGWTFGTVDQLVVGRDGLARRGIIKYQNSNENFKRTTDRHVRSLVKVFSLEDHNIDEDLTVLHERLQANSQCAALLKDLVDNSGCGELGSSKQSGKMVTSCCYGVSLGNCSCVNHCGLRNCSVLEDLSCWEAILRKGSVGSWNSVLYVNSYDPEEEDNGMEPGSLDNCSCSFSSMMQSLELNLN